MARRFETYEQLEREFAEWNHLDPAGMVACSSGTAALHLALEALGVLQNNGVVALPDFTMVACARAVHLAEGWPEFVDCDARLQIHPELVSEVGDARVIMPVHVYGRSPDVSKIELRSFYTPPHLVEDLAEAHGVRPHPLTSAACWSFYKNKVIAGEEGGAVWFKQREHAVRARCLRSLGFTDSHDFTHVPRGHNYRMSNAHADLVLKSLWRYEENVARRREIEGWYEEVCPDEWKMPERSVPWVYDLRS